MGAEFKFWKLKVTIDFSHSQTSTKGNYHHPDYFLQ